MGDPRHGSGQHPTEECRNEQRISRLEVRVDEHDRRLSVGDVGFAEVRKDIQALTKAVNDAVAMVQRAALDAGNVNWGHEVLRAVINWGVPIIALAVIWAVVKSGAVTVSP
jgi:hypothetical protein